MRFIILLPLLTLLFFQSCKSEPARKLTQEERIADIYWVFSKFDQNYAPKALKEKNFGFNYEDLKKQYLEEAKKDQENADFFQLLHKFIAEFKDAHTSGSFQTSALPGRSKIAYLGFKGKRDGTNLKVTSVLPTIKTSKANDFDSVSNYPIHKDDIILEIDGMTLFEAIEAEILPYRNLGNNQSNKTGLINKLFTRNSSAQPLPKKDMAVIKVRRLTEEFEVEIPWVVKDFVTFRNEQKNAIKEKARIESRNPDYKLDITEKQYDMIKTMTQMSLQNMINMDVIKDILKNEKDFDVISKKFYENIENYNVLDTFKLPQEEYLWSMLELFEIYFSAAAAVPKTIIDTLKEVRYVPATAYAIEQSKFYPAYITFMKNDQNQRESIGYIRINTFSPAGQTANVLKEFKDTLKEMADFGVNKIVLDLIDNGGGSLELGAKLIQALSTEKLEMSQIEFKLNENWIDNFHSASLNADSDFEKEIARRTYVELDKQRFAGEKLSTAFDYERLYPFQIIPNSKLIVDQAAVKFELVLVTNEMCASMCDIFTAMFQDNKMGQVIGTQTMGAGGNVTTHFQAPNSGLIIRQTESLIVRTDKEKSYLENNGVKPDIETEIYNERNTKYETSLKKAFETLVPAPKPEEIKEENQETTVAKS